SPPDASCPDRGYEDKMNISLMLMNDMHSGEQALRQ
ncbi:hypothetical protein HMPREF1033_01511, partial [Tannerella sp. 6_1_58FAA_CT1]